MQAQSGCIAFKLARHIAHVQSGETRRTRAIAFPFQPMTGEAGVRRACIAAAQSDEMAGALEPLHRGRIGRAAPGKQSQTCKGANGGGWTRTMRPGTGNSTLPRWLHEKASTNPRHESQKGQA